MKTNLIIDSPILEISSTDDSTTKEITMLVHKCDIPNGNGLDFKQVYTEQFLNTLVDKPVVTQYYPLKDDLGDHAAVFDSKGNIVELQTIAIGTITEAWIGNFPLDDESEGATKALYAKAVVWSYKYPKIISCIEKLFADGNSTSSVEVEVYEYLPNPTKTYRAPSDYSYLGNCLLGSTVAPADNDAGVINVFQKEIAMAVKEDLQSQESTKGGEVVAEESKPITETFNKGKKINFHGKVESASLTFDEISNQIYNQLNPIDPKTGNRDYEYWISDIYNDYVIVEEWCDYNDLYKIFYKVVNDTVVLDPEENWVRGTRGFIPDGVNIDSLIVDNKSAAVEMETKINELNATHKEVADLMEEKVQELETKVQELSNKVTELEGTIVSQQETIKQHETKEAELNQEINTLKPFKEQVETAENQTKKNALVEKFSNLISEEAMKSEQVVNAIEALDEVALNSIVVSEVAKDIASKGEGKKEKTVIVNARTQEDLVPQDLKERMYTPKSV